MIPTRAAARSASSEVTALTLRGPRSVGQEARRQRPCPILPVGGGGRRYVRAMTPARRAWAAMLASCLALVAVGVSAGSAQVPAAPLAGTEIGYQCGELSDFGPAACAISGTGTNPHVLFDETAAFGYGQESGTGNTFLSPNGLWGAYNAYLPGADDGLWVEKTDGTDAHSLGDSLLDAGCEKSPGLSCDGAATGQPAWSPASSEIALPEPQSGTKLGIDVVDLQSGMVSVVKGHDGRPITGVGDDVAWSPNAKQLAFVNSVGALQRVAVSGGTPTTIALLPRSPGGLVSLSWSPNGTTILVTTLKAVSSVPAKGGTLKTLFAYSSFSHYQGAYWSPDSSRMVVSTSTTQTPELGANPDPPELFTAAPDGTDATDLSDLPGLGATGWVRTPPGNAARLAAQSPRYAEVAANGTVTDFGGATLPALQGIAGLASPIVAATESGITPSNAGYASPGLLAADTYFLAASDGTVYNDVGAVVWNASTAAPATSGPGLAGDPPGAPPTAPIVAAAGYGGAGGQEVSNQVTVTTFVPELAAADGSEYPTPPPSGTLPPPPGYTAADGPVAAAILFPNSGGRPTLITSNGVLIGGPSTEPDDSATISETQSPVVGIALDPGTAGGYWIVDAQGDVFPIGAARQGDLGHQPATNPVVAIAADPATGGYWLVTQDGTVHGFDAPNEGTTAGTAQTSPTVAILTQPRTPTAGPDVSNADVGH
jgi:hypothetical protein